ncbi:MAG: hypothetical protein ABJQ23_09785 [Shimia thalassica]|uniref:hypothetical protein n=1 Tax=Shimia thalassica TaxID=1715693 RepID=UPI003298315B
MKNQDFELKRALDTYFRTQFQIQEKLLAEMIENKNQTRALLQIFGAAAERVDKK